MRKPISTRAGARTLFAALTAGWAAAIFFFSVSPSVGGGLNSGVGAHVAAYFMLCLLLTGLLRCLGRPGALWRAFVLAWLYGAAIELVQALIPYRAFEVADIAMNCAAAAAALVPARVCVLKQWL